MAENKQCPYRNQEHKCIGNELPSNNVYECELCLAGQQVDAIELVASAIMERVMR